MTQDCKYYHFVVYWHLAVSLMCVIKIHSVFVTIPLTIISPDTGPDRILGRRFVTWTMLL